MLTRPSLTGGAAAIRGLVLLSALVLAALPLTELLEGPAWLLVTLLGAVPVIGLGILARQILRGSVLVPLVQVGAIVATIVALCSTGGLLAPGTGWRGLPVAIAETVLTGLQDLAEATIPVPVSPASLVVLVVFAALAALALDLMVVDLGWHSPAAVMLAAFALLPALHHPSGSVWWSVLGPILAALILLALRTLHPDSEAVTGETRPQVGPLHRPVGTAMTTTLVLALVLAAAIPLGGALPPLSATRQPLSIERVNQWFGTGTPTAGLPGPVMVDPSVSVRRTLLQQSGREVLRYRTDDPEPGYLRQRVLAGIVDDEFVPVDGLPAEQRRVPSDATLDENVDRPGSDEHVTTITLAGSPTMYLPAPERIRGAELPSGDTVPVGPDGGSGPMLATEPHNGELLYDGDGGHDPFSYSVLHSGQRPTTEELESVRREDMPAYPEDLGMEISGIPRAIRDYMQRELPDALDAPGPYEAGRILENHFHTEYTYSLTAVTPAGEDPLTSFLTDRTGYCEQYAATFALMMQSMGYPTRVVVGYTAGHSEGEDWVVSGRNAHAWPEVWFGEDIGWVAMEPTPPGAAPGVGGVGAVGPDQSDEQDEPTPETPQSTAPTPETSDPEQEPTLETPTDEAADGATGTGSDGAAGGAGSRGLLLGLGGLALAAGALAAVIGTRRHRARRDAVAWQQALADGPDATARHAWETIAAAVHARTRRDARIARFVRTDDELPPLQLPQTVGPDLALATLAETLCARLPAPPADVASATSETGGRDRSVRRPPQAPDPTRIRAAATALGTDLVHARYAPPGDRRDPAAIQQDAQVMLDALRERRRRSERRPETPAR